MCIRDRISAGQLPGGAPMAANVGAVVWNQYSAPFGDINMYGNTVGYSKADGSRNDWWLPDCDGQCSNTALKPGQPITTADEQTAITGWESRAAAGGIHLGPTIGGPPPTPTTTPTPTPVPASDVPANVHTTAVTGTSLALVWNPVTSVPVKYYYIYEDGADIDYTTTLSWTPSQAMQPGEAHRYQVAVKDTAGVMHPKSASITVSTTGSPGPTPTSTPTPVPASDVPANVHTTAVTGTSLALAWNPVTSVPVKYYYSYEDRSDIDYKTTRSWTPSQAIQPR